MSMLSMEVSDSSIAVKRPRAQYDLTPTKVFPDLQSAQEEIKKTGVYSCHYKSPCGYVLYYRCKAVIRRAKRQCDSKVKLCMAKDSLDVLMYTSIAAHNHHELELRSIGIPAATKVVIIDLLDKKVTKEKIRDYLNENDHLYQNETQLSNFLAEERKRRAGPQIISLSDFDGWCKSHTGIPENDNDSFVLNHEVIYKNEGLGTAPQFRVFITTKKLLNNARNTNFICADATYKIVWEGYPALVLGTTNINRQFALIGIGLCSGEAENDFHFMFSSLYNRALETGTDLKHNIR